MKPAYDIFISHSSRDKAIVKALATRLRRFRPYASWWRLPWPSRLAVFVDDDEKAGVVLWEELDAALAKASTLIVACSPHARVSANVAREITTFRAFHPAGNVVPILVGGLPNEVAKREGRDQDAAIPEVMADVLGGEAWPPKFVGPDAFARANRDHWYHLLSAILKTTRTIVEGRERKRRRRRYLATAAVVAVVAVAAWAFWRREVRNYEAALPGALDAARDSPEPELAMLLAAHVLEYAAPVPGDRGTPGEARTVLWELVRETNWSAAADLQAGEVHALVWLDDRHLLAGTQKGLRAVDPSALPRAQFAEAGTFQPVVLRAGSGVVALRTHPTQPLVAALTKDGQAVVFDGLTSVEKHSWDAGGNGALAWWCSSDSVDSVVAGDSFHGPISRWDIGREGQGAIQLGEELGELTSGDGDSGCVYFAAIAGGQLRVWARKPSPHPPVPVGEPVALTACCVRWSPVRQAFATATHQDVDNRLAIWTMDRSRPRRIVNEPLTGSVADIAWSPDGRHLATVSHDRVLRIWTMDFGRPAAGAFAPMPASIQVIAVRLLGDSTPSSVAWHPDGTSLAVGDSNGRVRLFAIFEGSSGGGLVTDVDSIVLRGEPTRIWPVYENLVWGRIVHLATDPEHRSRISDRDFAAFARRYVGRWPLTEDECRRYLGRACE